MAGLLASGVTTTLNPVVTESRNNMIDDTRTKEERNSPSSPPSNVTPRESIPLPDRNARDVQDDIALARWEDDGGPPARRN